MGKGSSRRQEQIPPDEMQRRWDMAFPKRESSVPKEDVKQPNT